MKNSCLTLRVIWVSILIVFNSCKVLNRNNETFSLFTPDAIESNQNYFTKSVLEYHLINSAINKFGVVESKAITKMTAIDTTVLRREMMTIFVPNPEESEEYYYSASPLVECSYLIPKTLDDLESGFQYRYYVFSGKSSAAMQAFGVTDISGDVNAQYLVIDYLQFKDCKCEDLPTIRYAVGIRSELKISSRNSVAEIDGIGSLSGLAAKVELGQTEVNFSLKTIGVTGLESRLNIPQGVSFDVTTYKDFQNSIEFIKNRIGDSTVNIHPELIPVMDGYRPNTKASLSYMADEITDLYELKNRIKKNDLLDITDKDNLISMVDSQITNIFEQRRTLNEVDRQLYSLDKYEKILSATTNKKAAKFNRYSEDLEESEFDEWPILRQLDNSLLSELLDIYFISDGITYEGFYRFLDGVEALNPDDAMLARIINDLNKIIDVNDINLDLILSKLRTE